MKTLPLLVASLLPLSATPENSLIPSTWFQEITATDGSTQQCIIFTTVPGVEYTFYHSNDLVSWTEVAQTYGLGHEFSAAMRETAPAPPPTDPQNLPPVPEPLVSASISIAPSSGAAGGTVVSWPSLDHGNAVRHLITATMATEWESVPIFSENHGDHWFAIAPITTSVTPPATNGFLGQNDAAMIADFEAGFAAFNQAVTSSVITARNTPPPPPPAPDSKGFWRIKADWSLDSDNDGSYDHAEFALAASEGAAPDGLAGNAFNSDSNEDGIPDGEQLDADGDGIPDALDIDSNDGRVAYAKVALPRYAMFSIPDSPYQTFAINDRGTALSLYGYWKSGETHGLITDEYQIPGYPLSEGNEGAAIHALTINDNDQIIGAGIADLENPANGGDRRRISSIIYWSAPQAVPAIISSTAGSTITYADRKYRGNYYAARHLDNNGCFFSPAVTWDLTRPDPGPKDLDDGWKKWTLPPGGEPITVTPAPEDSKGTAAGGIVWGSTYNYSGAWLHSNITLPFSAEIPVLEPEVVVAQGAGGNILAVSRYVGFPTMVRQGEEWGVSPLLEDVRDIADDGTAIRKSADNSLRDAILLNGKWTSLDRAVPGIPERWKTSTNAWLSYTTPGGWILAHDRPGEDNISAAFLPLRVKGRYTRASDNTFIEEAAGVDAFSIGSSDTRSNPDNTDPIEDRIWVMAPSDSTGTIILKAPVHPSAPLKISAPLSPNERGITFNGDDELEITAPETVITVENQSGHPEGELYADLKLGDQKSISQPIGFKLMKKRTIRIALNLITSKVPGKPDNPPDLAPTKAELEPYLNELFGTQLNAYVEVTLFPHIVEFDRADSTTFPTPVYPEAGNGILDKHDWEKGEMSPIIDHKKGLFDINVFVIGGASPIQIFEPRYKSDDETIHYLSVDRALGEANLGTGQNTCIIDGDRTGKSLQADEMTKLSVMHTIAHEIGHLMVGGDHPDEEDNNHVAPLPGTRHVHRLMCSGHTNNGNISRQLVKAEWDAAEKWLQAYPDQREAQENQNNE